MGKGPGNRADKRRRLAKIRPVLDALKKINDESGSISDLDAFIRKHHGGAKNRPEIERVRVLIMPFLKQSPDGKTHLVIPKELGNALSFLGSNGKVKVPQLKHRAAKPATAKPPPEPEPNKIEEPTEEEVMKIEQVPVEHVISVSVNEAETLLKICKNGLPEEMPYGSATKLGQKLVTTLKSGDMVVSIGRGKAARLHTESAEFDKTQFIVDSDRQDRQHRFGYPKKGATQAPGVWLENLRQQFAKLQPSVEETPTDVPLLLPEPNSGEVEDEPKSDRVYPPPSDKPPPTLPAPKPITPPESSNDDWEIEGYLATEVGYQTEQVAQAEMAAKPYLERIEKAKRSLEKAQRALAVYRPETS